MDIIVGIVRKLGGTKILASLSRVGGAKKSLSGADLAPGLSKGWAKVFALEEIELLEQVDLLEPLANCLKPPATSFLATLWVATPYKGTWQREGAIL